MKQPRFPIYIISKGRADTRYTAKSLEWMGVDYHIVVEPQEYDQYAAVIDPKKIFVLPFSNLHQGGIPARNWCWEDSVQRGFEWHWVLDDNIRGFYRHHLNTKCRVKSPVAFRAIEDLVTRYENVYEGGMQYTSFLPSYRNEQNPYYINARIYSCILIRNSFPGRWRVLSFKGKPAPFNEDTDLSLRILKAGHATLMSKQFTANKLATMKMKGGNTEEVYKQHKEGFDNRYTFAASLAEAHPDCVQVVKRNGRWHHLVDYSRWERNPLSLKHGLTYPEEYDTKLKLVKLTDSKDPNSSWVDADINDLIMDIE